MEVEVISSEIIKPSSPTPENLRRYKLSFLDQLSPEAYGPLLYYYALNDHIAKDPNYISEISDKLKKSLSQALTLYYPLAGRFIDDRFLDCNDDGVPYFEARVKTKISDVLGNPIPCELNKLLPFELDEIAAFPLGIQLNVFECGGIAIGLCLNHRLEDALSCLVFVRSWMAIARGENDIVARPEFISGDLFPPRNMGGHDPSCTIEKNMCTTNITKRFVFEARKIEALRAKYEERKSEEGIINNHNVIRKRRLSRISALSAFLWSRYMAATKSLETEAGKNYVILHPVNIRPRCDPPLGEHSFGNYYTTAATVGTITSACTGEEYCYGLARKIGEEIRRVDKEFVKNNIQETGDELVEIIKKDTERFIKEEVIGIVITSLCRFPLYEADFGYGKPKWVSSAARGFINLFAFMDNRAGDGIEAYICLKADDMAKLEVDKEFLALVSPDIAALDEFTIPNGA